MPNSGPGRWINVAAGLGWDGFTGEFQPKPRERVIPWSISGVGAGTPSVSLVTASWTQLPPVVAPVLASSDLFDFDFDFSMGAVGAGDNTVAVRVEVSYNGGSYTPVSSTTRTFSTSATNVLDRHAIHISGRYSASLGAGTYTFRLKGKTNSFDDDMYFHDEWLVRGVQYVAL